MIRDLGLGGDELIVYACIYSFNRGTGNDFFGSLKYLSKWTSSGYNTILRALNSLCEKELLIKNTMGTEKGNSFFSYKAKTLEKPCFVEIKDDELDELFPD